ncbi:MAG: HK97 family phage prohead protease [Acidimicrobiales bacterium]
MDDTTPVDNLYRGRPRGVTLEGRDDTDEPTVDDATMVGHFTVFDTWTEIHSWFEGDFLERVAPGAFTKTIRENLDQVKVQYDHGYDFHVGDSPLGPIDVLREDDIGPYFEVPLLDTDYNRDRILPMLRGRVIAGGDDRGSVLGASFRFKVMKDEWVREPKPSASNPDGLAERTIREVKLYEFGPVVFPAYPDATAGVRSLTDHYLERQRERRSKNPDHTGAGRPATPGVDPDEPATGHSTASRGLSVASARTRLIALGGTRP